MAQGQATQGMSADQVERVEVEKAREAVEAGRALLVCAYDDAKCARMRLGGSITVRELEQRAASLPKDQEIIFYCA
jgi:rhodanese-related sulfurtransferase